MGDAKAIDSDLQIARAVTNPYQPPETQTPGRSWWFECALTLITMLVVYATMLLAIRLFFQEAQDQGFAIFLTSIPIFGLLWGLRSLVSCLPAALGGWLGMALSLALVAWMESRLAWQDLINLLRSSILFFGIFLAGSLLGFWIKRQMTLRM